MRVNSSSVPDPSIGMFDFSSYLFSVNKIYKIIIRIKRLQLK